jgi:hypothetical protein
MEDVFVKNLNRVNQFGTLAVTLPARMCAKLNLTNKSKVALCLEGNSIQLTKFEPEAFKQSIEGERLGTP